MKYPAEFVEAVKREYPCWEDIHEALAEGSETVGRYLSDSQRTVSPDRIVTLIDQGKVDILRAEAEQCIRKGKLYGWWGRLYDAQNSQRR